MKRLNRKVVWFLNGRILVQQRLFHELGSQTKLSNLGRRPLDWWLFRAPEILCGGGRNSQNRRKTVTSAFQQQSWTNGRIEDSPHTVKVTWRHLLELKEPRPETNQTSLGRAGKRLFTNNTHPNRTELQRQKMCKARRLIRQKSCVMKTEITGKIVDLNISGSFPLF